MADGDMMAGGGSGASSSGDKSAFLPRSLRFLTYNVKGLNIPEKRGRLLRELQALRTSVVFLQEMHFRADAPPQLLTRAFPTGFFSNYTQGKSRGTAILFAKDVPFVVIDTLCDDEGRYLFVKGSISGVAYTFASIYLPNVNQHRCLAKIMKVLDKFQTGILIVAGDLNVPLDPRVDTSRHQSTIPPSSIRHLKRTLDSLHLVDVWRALNSGARDFTYYSSVHASFSRIDYLFMQQHQLHLLLEADIGTRTWSDHSPVWMSLTSPLYRPRERSWRLNTHLLEDPGFSRELSGATKHYFEENAGVGEISEVTVWEAHKAVVRGLLISKAVAIHKAKSTETVDLLNGIRRLEQSLLYSSDDADFKEATLLRRRLNDILNEKLRLDAARAKCRFALQENKPGKLLAHLLRQRRETNYVSKIKTGTGRTSPLPDVIVREFESYYRKLYDMEGTTGRVIAPPAISRYLQDKIHTTLSPEGTESLSAPFTEVELLTVMKLMKKGKSPGPDGLSLEYYKHFATELYPRMLSAFQSVGADTSFHPHTVGATIAVIPKPGKDESECRNYRPISLLNTDAKIFAKLLAERLKPFLSKLVRPDQVGFMPGREARYATSRALGAVAYAKKTGEGVVLLSMDAEKAFDKVSWSFLFLVLRQMGLPDIFLDQVQALYTNPSARIRVNGALSAPIPICNGTRQGCPLSPLLFALYLEPLLEAVRSTDSITGIQGTST
uniref:Reverse transcriptase domain-containing protein n=1 Tax=Leptobrachium leishanense TaxID=445787 RepID=A0A8C5MMF1_9ANUR